MKMPVYGTFDQPQLQTRRVNEDEVGAARGARQPFAVGSRWATVLAGGDGVRLGAMTRLIAGDDRPKQFCSLVGSETLVGQTVRRVSRSVSEENLMLVLTEKHRKFFPTEFDKVAPEHLIVQPSNKGTAPAILYTLMRLSVMDPRATIAFFPSDHHIEDEETFLSFIELAYIEAESGRSNVILLGIEPDKPEPEYGWIDVAGYEDDGICPVRAFWEKPSCEKATELFNAGGLWNSFIMVGAVSAFVDLVADAQPTLFMEFVRSIGKMNTRSETPVMRGLYKTLKRIDFSRDILQKDQKRLRVLKLPAFGWADLGHETRVKSVRDRAGIASLATAFPSAV